MSDIVKSAKSGNWGMLTMLIMFGLIGIFAPLATKQAMIEGAKDVISPLVESIDTLESNIEEIQGNIDNIEKSIDGIQTFQYHEVLENGLAGYKKVGINIDKLNTSTQNAAAIKRALSHPEVRELLLSIHREQTLMYEEYFRLN